MLVLRILYQGVSIPIFWVNLSKKGHSNFDERKRLLQMASRLYCLKGMTLLADREYIGREWFRWLVEEMGLDWVIRVPIRDYKHEISQGKKSYSALIKKARAGKLVAQAVEIAGKPYQFVALIKERNDKQIKINRRAAPWQFSIESARNKLNRHYTQVNQNNEKYKQT